MCNDFGGVVRDTSWSEDSDEAEVKRNKSWHLLTLALGSTALERLGPAVELDDPESADGRGGLWKALCERFALQMAFRIMTSRIF